MKKAFLFMTIAMLLFPAAMHAQNNGSKDRLYLNIYYLYADNLSPAADPYKETYLEGEQYDVTSPEVEGFQPDKAFVKGTMPDHDVIDTVLYFPKANTYTITTASDPIEGGTTTGDGVFEEGTEVTVTAEANGDFVFVNWTENEESVSEEPSYTFTVNSNRNLVAIFALDTYTISVSANPSNGGSVSGNGTYHQGQSCTVIASSADGYSFLNWTENEEEVSTKANYTFEVNRDRSLVANFEAVTPSYTVTIDSHITHGTLVVSPSGEVEVGNVVAITATPDENYELETIQAYKLGDESQQVSLSENTFVMPNYDVFVTATFKEIMTPPVIIGFIETPAVICVGESLELTAPMVINAENEGWEMAANQSFDPVMAYTGQPLDASFDGWKLRYAATNVAGTVYSNVVTVTVKAMDHLGLTGDIALCSGQEGEYTLNATGNFNLNWNLSDAVAVVTETNNGIKVHWETAGEQTVSVDVEDIETGCSVSLSLTVHVQSFVSASDLENIVVKDDADGTPYILIYPNPKDAYKYQWYKDMEAISGANGQYYYVSGGLADGTYQVYVSLNTDSEGNLICGAFSADCIVSSNKAAFSISPNPACNGEQFVISNHTGKDALMQVYTLDGRLVHRQVVCGEQVTLDNPLPQGFYLIRFDNDGAMYKVVVQ